MANKNTTTSTLKRINADIRNLVDVRRAFVDSLKSWNLSQNDLESWELVFSEVVSNAIRHGSTSPDHDVVIEWWKDFDEVVLSVVDQGNGPDPYFFEFPNLPLDPEAVSGRGMYLISRFASRWDHCKTPTGYRQLVGRNICPNT